MVETLNLDKKKIYSQLFEIFEKELNTIFEYIAPIETNNNTCWNRLHELLLRLWAEVENIAKEVCNDIAKNEKEDTKRIESAQSKDFLWYLIEKISINKKTLRFIWWLEEWIKLRKPFSASDWWEHYDALKHWKIEKYGDCNLNDVIMAFWWYYILLNYMLLWYKWIRQCNWLSMMESEKTSIPASSIFSPTFVYHEFSMNLEVGWYFWIIDESSVDEIKNYIKSSDKMIKLDHGIKNYVECLFWVYWDITSFVTPQSIRQAKLKNLPNVQKTYILGPVFAFTNNGIVFSS